MTGQPPSTLSAAARLGLLAPRRNRLSKTLGSGLLPKPTFPGAAAPLTFLHIIPIEAPCYAVRLGFANSFDLTMTVAKASVYPSDSYGVLADDGNAGLRDGTPHVAYRVSPTGNASGSRIYFDHAGADAGTIGFGGSQRSLTLAADTSNFDNRVKAFTIRWSDFAPCTSIPRADGRGQHLLFVYVTISSPQMVQGSTAHFAEANADALAHRGRHFWVGHASSIGTDCADDPAATTYRSHPMAPLFALQYLTPSLGVQGVLNGDSLAASPTNDGFSTPLHRAAADLSTPEQPIELASMAWGAATSTSYEVMLRDNMPALRASFVAYQPISRNDSYSPVGLQLLLAKALANIDTFRAGYGTVPMWNIAGCIPCEESNTLGISAFTDMRSRLQEMAESSGTPLIDAPAVIGEADRPWIFRAGMSDDGVHPNFAAAEAAVPMAKAALRQVLHG